VPAGSWVGIWIKAEASLGVLSGLGIRLRYIYHKSSERSHKVDSDCIQAIAKLVSWSGGIEVTGLGFGLGRRGRIPGGEPVRGGPQSPLCFA
jgi:hypothetical protein